MENKLIQIVGILLRKAEDNMPSGDFKDGYITALKDILLLLKENN